MKSVHSELPVDMKLLNELGNVIRPLCYAKMRRAYKSMLDYEASAETLVKQLDEQSPVLVARSSLPGSAVELSPKEKHS